MLFGAERGAQHVRARAELRPGKVGQTLEGRVEPVDSDAEDVRVSDKSLRVVPIDGISTEFLHRLLSAPRARRQISARATGTKDSMRNISQAALLAIDVPAIDLGDQSAVVAAAQKLHAQCARLDEALTANLTRSAALRRALLTAAFSGMLTNHTSDTELAEEPIG